MPFSTVDCPKVPLQHPTLFLLKKFNVHQTTSLNLYNAEKTIIIIRIELNLKSSTVCFCLFLVLKKALTLINTY